MTDFSSLQRILDRIPDKARVDRTIARWQTDALDQETIYLTELKVIELTKKMDKHTMRTERKNGDEYLTSKEASKYLDIGMTMFIKYKRANAIHVAQQIGPKHLFSKVHLDNFLETAVEVRNTMLANAPPPRKGWGRPPKVKTQHPKQHPSDSANTVLHAEDEVAN